MEQHLKDLLSKIQSIPTEGQKVSYFLSGEAAFFTMKNTVDKIKSLAPKDHDIIIKAFNLSVEEVFYIEPQTFVFSGYDNEGNISFIICHFSQLLVHIIHQPKKGKERMITGFSQTKSS